MKSPGGDETTKIIGQERRSRSAPRAEEKGERGGGKGRWTRRKGHGPAMERTKEPTNSERWTRDNGKEDDGAEGVEGGDGGGTITGRADGGHWIEVRAGPDRRTRDRGWTAGGHSHKEMEGRDGAGARTRLERGRGGKAEAREQRRIGTRGRSAPHAEQKSERGGGKGRGVRRGGHGPARERTKGPTDPESGIRANDKEDDGAEGVE